MEARDPIHRAGNRKYKYLPDSPKAQTKSPEYTGVDPITADPTAKKLHHSRRCHTNVSPTAKDYTTREGVTLTYPGRIVRLVNTEFDTKHPKLLDDRHTLVRLLARSLHHKLFHQVLDYMRSVLNMKHTILGLRRLFRSSKNQCEKCRKRKASTIQTIMSDLHFEPLGYKQPPFNHTGVGYFGPLYVPVRRSTEKRCEFLFTCLTTRAFTCLVPSLDIVLVSWALNVVIHQARSSRITARTLLVRKRN